MRLFVGPFSKLCVRRTTNTKCYNVVICMVMIVIGCMVVVVLSIPHYQPVLCFHPISQSRTTVLLRHNNHNDNHHHQRIMMFIVSPSFIQSNLLPIPLRHKWIQYSSRRNEDIPFSNNNNNNNNNTENNNIGMKNDISKQKSMKKKKMNPLNRMKRIKEEEMKLALIHSLLQLDTTTTTTTSNSMKGGGTTTNGLTQVTLVGKIDLPLLGGGVGPTVLVSNTNDIQPCAVLVTANNDDKGQVGTIPLSSALIGDMDPPRTIPALLIPLDDTTQRQWKLIEYEARVKKSDKRSSATFSAGTGSGMSPLTSTTTTIITTPSSSSFSIFLQNNIAFLNRDGGLYDNLPYTSWMIDINQNKYRDAAKNPMAPIYHLGKRYFYNQLLTGGGTGRRRSDFGNGIISQYTNLQQQKKTDTKSSSTQQSQQQQQEQDQNGNNIFDWMKKLLTNEMQTGVVSQEDVLVKSEEISANDDANNLPLMMIENDTSTSTTMSMTDMIVLSIRVLGIQIKELTMILAEIDEQLAISIQEQNEFLELRLEQQKETIQKEYHEKQKQSQELQQTTTQRSLLSSSKPATRTSTSTIKNNGTGNGRSELNTNESNNNNLLLSWLTGTLQDFLSNPQMDPTTGSDSNGDRNNNNNNNNMDRQTSSINKSKSTYRLLRDMIREQMNAEIIGCVVENTNLFDNNNNNNNNGTITRSTTTTLGGLIVLRRLSPQKTITINGEVLKVKDSDETYGNIGITGGTTILVECQVDEAIGMHLACTSIGNDDDDDDYDDDDDERPSYAPLYIETQVWDRYGVMVKPIIHTDLTQQQQQQWVTVNPNLTVFKEGMRMNSNNTNLYTSVLPIRLPRTSDTLWDRFMEQSNTNTGTGVSSTTPNEQVFPTENPIESLNQYDSLSNEDKVRTLLSLSNFQGKLPRPRVLRRSSSSNSDSKSVNPLDTLLLPLIDEGVRNQYLLRDATIRGDTEQIQLLQQKKSKRQNAFEQLENAIQNKNVFEIQKWEKEIQFLSTLRADMTQDEGSYSTYLDRDDWYERQRQQNVKKMNKKKFGNLFDGIS